MSIQEFTSKRMLRHFNDLTAIVFSIILFFLMIGISIGTIKLFLQLGDLFNSGKVTGSYINIIADVLSLFILIELSRSLVDYFDIKRLRLTFIVDAAIVFVLREIMIQLFQHKLPGSEMYAMSVLLFVLGLLRIASVVVYQRGQMLLESGSVSPAELPNNRYKKSNPEDD